MLLFRPVLGCMSQHDCILDGLFRRGDRGDRDRFVIRGDVWLPVPSRVFWVLQQLLHRVSQDGRAET